MKNFTKHIILENNEIIAQELKRAREAKQITLTEVSLALKIKISYLKYLESGDFACLPKGVYKINFLREYAEFLGLSAERLIALYKKEEIKPDKDLFIKKVGRAHYFITIPKLAKNMLIFLAAFLSFAYLFYCLNAIMAPPTLIVNDSFWNTTIKQKEITVFGESDPEAEITINDELVLADKQGNFQKKINLKKGLNTIIIIAHKKYSRNNELVKKVIVSDS